MKHGAPHLLIFAFISALAGGLVFAARDTQAGIDDRDLHPMLQAWQRGGPVSPVPHPPPSLGEKAALGEALFHSRLLSHDGSIACASCHSPEAGGGDGRPHSVGVGGAVGEINAPSVLNAALGLAQFWDGRAATLEEQVAGPIHEPHEMGSSWEEVLARLAADPPLRARFDRIYPHEGISPATVADAISHYERSLVPVDADFDRYLRGDERAISATAREGFARFKAFGCASCHQGVGVGGNMYQRFGVMGDYFADRGGVTEADLGRYRVTGRDEDRHVFKVPSLRNVALTAPYFHDGSAATLDEAIRVMARYQLGREIGEDDRRLIAAFLESLTGRVAPRATR
ncbi:MAG: c-type cytochrome [Thauera phenolivorans]|uniref:C-type cytochrome n=1 Tax=Thauera phenolivorans TaxID=1792543 RepID=A0A7X7R8C2_9RHOO|nr:c-type cytochrome [Thauera phenolivorans]